MYVAIKNIIKEKIRNDVKSASLPVIHLLIDEWWSKLLKQRFIAIRIRYVDSNFELNTFLLSVRHYDKAKVDKDVKKASEILEHWMKGVLSEFGINVSMIYSATSDAGPEVRCMLSKLMSLPWEWCASHLLTRAIKETCGQLKSQEESEEFQEIRKLVQLINKVVSKIQNTESALKAFERICWERFGKHYVLKSYLDIRFLGIVNMLERVVKLWSCLNDLYEYYWKKPFPLPSKHELEQLYGLFNEVKFIQEHSQTRSHPVTCTTFLMLLDLDCKVLEPGSSIKVSDNQTVADGDLVPFVKKVRTDLHRSLDKRFYNRFRETHRESRGSGAPAEDCLLEMATVMHPAYKKLTCLNKTYDRINDSQGDPGAKDQFKKKIYEKVVALAKKVAEPQVISRRLEPELTNVAQSDHIDHMADDYDLSDALSESLNINDDVALDTTVMQNFDRYMHEQGDRDRQNQKYILEWWRTKKSSYPYLSQVARTLLGVEVSSGAIELDIGVGGKFVTKEKLSLSTVALEMKLFVKRNYHIMDWNRITVIPEEEIEAHLPHRPQIPFVAQEYNENGQHQDSIYDLQF